MTDACSLKNSKETLCQSCPILMLCCGELHSQVGDMVKALDFFQKASVLMPGNPLSYVNAARTYQQLSQVKCCNAIML
jgi:predicted Zn-dependent protease